MIDAIKSVSSSVVARGVPIRPFSPELSASFVRIPKADYEKKYIILWVPGTNDHRIPSVFLDSFKNL